MEKNPRKTIRVVAILFMLATAQLAVTYSYAEIEEPVDLVLPEELKSAKIFQQERLGTIVTEKLVNGKLEVKQFALPEDTTKDDMSRILSEEGVSGWSFVSSKAYHSGIVLFDGKASKVGEKFWKFSVNGILNLSKGELELELIGRSNSSQPEMIEDHSKENMVYRVIFSGKMVKSDEEDIFAVAFTNSNLKNSESNLDPKLQFGNSTSESRNSIDCNQKIKNSILVV
ncbi:MAG: hypothetical protein OEQ12_01840 [Nitrosopumilus sp.]|nr:hypothetical protein [Nitrosopumilus sp.]